MTERSHNAYGAPMPNRDVESIRSKDKFLTLLRHVAAAPETNSAVRIQVAGKRFLVPSHAQLSVEHEVTGSEEELELQLKWRTLGAPEARGTSKKGAKKGTKKGTKKKAAPKAKTKSKAKTRARAKAK
jgi:hypothetical protein